MMNLIITLPRDNGEVLELFVPEPDFKRVEACLPVFQKAYKINKEISESFEVYVKDFTITFSQELKDERVKFNFNCLVEEVVESMKQVCKEDTKEEDNQGKKLYDSFTDYERDTFIALFVFIYALLRYAPPQVTKNELQAFYTQSTFTEYRNSFLKFIKTEQ